MRIMEFYVKSFFVWNICVNFGGTWLVVHIVCIRVIEFWLILWRDQYVYLFYHMKRRRKKSLTISLEGLVSYALNHFGFGAWQVCSICHQVVPQFSVSLIQGFFFFFPFFFSFFLSSFWECDGRIENLNSQNSLVSKIFKGWAFLFW